MHARGIAAKKIQQALAASKLGRAIYRFLHIHLIRTRPPPDTTECPLPSHMHTSPRPPAIPPQRAYSKNLNGSVPSHQEHFGAHQTQTWVAQSVRDSAEQLPSLSTPKAGSCPCKLWLHRNKDPEVLGWYSELDTIHQCLGFTSNLLYTSPSLNTHL